jgi:ribosomal protein L32
MGLFIFPLKYYKPLKPLEWYFIGSLRRFRGRLVTGVVYKLSTSLEECPACKSMKIENKLTKSTILVYIGKEGLSDENETDGQK